MGFFDSLIPWFLFIIVISFILFALFSYFLGWVYPQTDSESDDNITLRRKWIGLFVLVALITIMASTGLNAFVSSSIY